MTFLSQMESAWWVPLFALYIACGALLFLAFGLCLKGRSSRGYACTFLSVSSCGAIAAYFCKDGGLSALGLTACLSGLLFGVTYPLFVGILALDNRRKNRKEQNRRLLKGEKFLLPDKNNDFLRDRLKNSLCAKTVREIPVDEAFELGYIRRTLTKLKGKNLSPADRVELERISGELTKLCFETSVTDEELRAVNERFARVLKLAAKYAV